MWQALSFVHVSFITCRPHCGFPGGGMYSPPHGCGSLGHVTCWNVSRTDTVPVLTGGSESNGLVCVLLYSYNAPQVTAGLRMSRGLAHSWTQPTGYHQPQPAQPHPGEGHQTRELKINVCRCTSLKFFSGLLHSIITAKDDSYTG